MKKFIKEFRNKKILVTGGTGSIGSEIVRQLIPYRPQTIRIFARGEQGHHRFKQELNDGRHAYTRFIIGDIRDRNRLKLAMDGIDIVFHAAAMKHVDMCDNDPFEAVATNILGTQNIIDIARELNVGKVIAISTDKAVNPEGILGVSKLMAEKLILNSFYYKGKNPTKFTCVRFGNVLGSNGSVLPLLKRQIMVKNYVTMTDPEMTRFVMTIPQAVSLVLNAAVKTKGQEIFVLKMPAVKLGDLVGAAIKYYVSAFNKKQSEIEIKIMGSRRGDKKHEQLLSDREADRVLETKDMYILTPKEDVWGYKHKSDYLQIPKEASKNFSSEHVKKLTEGEIMKLIKEIDGTISI